jgi:hypothetical protein
MIDERKAAIADDEPIIVAIGFGGRLELRDDHLRLIKNNMFGNVINLLGLAYGKVAKTIMVENISSISIVRPLLFPDFIRITYPGCPISSGHAHKDALAENALIMSLFDNRRFYELKDTLDVLRRRRDPGRNGRRDDALA